MVQIKMDKSKKKSSVKPLEMEPIAKQADPLNSDEEGTNGSAQSPQEPTVVDPVAVAMNVWNLAAAYACYYRSISVPLASILVALIVILTLEHIVHKATEHHKIKMAGDYTRSYNNDLKISNVDHWCLEGGDTGCKCDDVTEAIPHFENPGWTKAFGLNKELAEKPVPSDYYDVVFVGDGSVEEWNDRVRGFHLQRIANTKFFWNKMWGDDKDFNDPDAQLDGLALGIADDAIPHLLWRLENGEMNENLNPKVWWIVIGANDLRLGHCSEEVVLLGILLLAEYIHHHKKGAYVVINSILPQDTSVRVHNKGKFDLWPSIQSVNRQLKKFCENHRYFHFFDATDIFVRPSSPKVKGKQKGKQKGKEVNTKPDIIAKTMDADKLHLSLHGHKLWMKAINDFAKDLIYDTDLSDDAAPDEIETRE
mmetsp:Transcript_11641/g.19727  ORF Transcript_11641/g.19727 Transcript_11641/m.19727 type:complete len:422 (-) Transcript_11641:241-1506(-)|eukprot:CAMPEP_0116560656 /NCGR_PEP_ID=MMETSP0397-20121206/11116_1 /TAXON_ID=216820 /ORGANISM="Cyclophora tenuis, Strain ECT3854" /LENGTH=421 /DNA_ID=CAMNT_0004086647 /DNA_START=84 /DNA_END=1349 /DNA_ORIENTATION=+